MSKLTFTVTHLVQGAKVHRVTVPALQTGMTGHWFYDHAYTPDRDALAAVMPPSLRKAILRATFWAVRDAPSMPQQCDLWTVDHRALGTLYAYPDWLPEAREAGTPAHYDGKIWLPFRDLNIGECFYHGGMHATYTKTGTRSARNARRISRQAGRVAERV